MFGGPESSKQVFAMKRILLLATAVVMFSVFVASEAQTQKRPMPKPSKVGVFMRQKLAHSQEVLKGLVTEDFDIIAKNAQEIALLSQASNWQVLQTEEYLQQSWEFRRTANALTAAANDKNLDEAALRYVDMTMKCITCHKYVRGVRLAQRDGGARLDVSQRSR